jgi:glycosyltransferase involved in cell wall biosynthesis
MVNNGLNGDPILAVIINCYNYENFVQCSIKSVLSQKSRAYELVVVDDGSVDGSWRKIRELDVPSFRKENGGQVSACIFGLGKTTAPFVMFLDADDTLLASSIDKIVSSLDSNVSKLQFPLLRIDANGMIIGPPFPKLSAGRDRSLLARQVMESGAYISPPTSGNVFRRDICDMLRGSEYDTAVDGVILSAAPFFGDVISLDEPLGCYRIHNKNKSSTSRTPSPSLVAEHQRRFSRRVDHLRKIVKTNNISAFIKDPKDMYFYNKYAAYLCVLRGDRVPFHTLYMMATTFPSWYSFGRKFLTIVALIFIYLLPTSCNIRILRFRQTGARAITYKVASIAEFCRALLLLAKTKLH